MYRERDVYIYIYTYTYIYIHIHIYTSVYIYIYILSYRIVKPVIASDKIWHVLYRLPEA